MKRFVYIVLLLFAASSISAQDTIWPEETWPTSTPEEQGMSSDILADAMDAISNQKMHSLLVIRNGYIVLDTQYYPFDNDSIHAQYSATKSFVSTLVGIAYDRGELDSLDTSMLTFFQDYDVTRQLSVREAITVDHLLSMRSGLMMDVVLIGKPDWIQYAMDATIIGSPGIIFSYSGGNIHLLASIVENVSETPLFDYAETYLFEPIGIKSARWDTDPQGTPNGGDGLYLTPYDMARFGYLFLNDGKWNGDQIVSADWVETATMTHTSANSGFNYGYGWWMDKDETFYCAWGHKGQFICMWPDLNLLFVTTADADPLGVLGSLSAQIPAAIQANAELPSNPEAQARLQTEIEIAGTPPEPVLQSEHPDIQSEINAKRYLFEDNPLGWQAGTLTFNDVTAELELETIYGNYVLNIGLDRILRVNEVNMPDRFISEAPIAMQGRWAPRGRPSFIIDAVYLDGYQRWTYNFSFDDNLGLSVRASESILGLFVPANYTLVGTPE